MGLGKTRGAVGSGERVSLGHRAGCSEFQEVNIWSVNNLSPNKKVKEKGKPESLHNINLHHKSLFKRAEHFRHLG